MENECTARAPRGAPRAPRVRLPLRQRFAVVLLFARAQACLDTLPAKKGSRPAATRHINNPALHFVPVCGVGPSPQCFVQERKRNKCQCQTTHVCRRRNIIKPVGFERENTSNIAPRQTDVTHIRAALQCPAKRKQWNRAVCIELFNAPPTLPPNFDIATAHIPTDHMHAPVHETHQDKGRKRHLYWGVKIHAAHGLHEACMRLINLCLQVLDVCEYRLKGLLRCVHAARDTDKIPTGENGAQRRVGFQAPLQGLEALRGPKA